MPPRALLPGNAHQVDQAFRRGMQGQAISSGCAPALLPKETCAFNHHKKAICLFHDGKALDELDRVPFASLSWLRNVAEVAEVVSAFKEGCSKSAHQATKGM